MIKLITNTSKIRIYITFTCITDKLILAADIDSVKLVQMDWIRGSIFIYMGVAIMAV